jgi:hypothetical protein
MFESGYSVFERSYCTVCDCLIDAKSEDSLYCSRACRKAEAKKTFSMPIEEVRSTFKRTKSATSLSGLVEHGEQPSTRLLKGHSQTASHSGTDDQRTPVMLRPLPPKRSSYGSSLPRSIDLVTPDPQLFSLTGMSFSFSFNQLTGSHQTRQAQDTHCYV